MNKQSMTAWSYPEAVSQLEKMQDEVSEVERGQSRLRTVLTALRSQHAEQAVSARNERTKLLVHNTRIIKPYVTEGGMPSDLMRALVTHSDWAGVLSASGDAAASGRTAEANPADPNDWRQSHLFRKALTSQPTCKFGFLNTDLDFANTADDHFMKTVSAQKPGVRVADILFLDHAFSKFDKWMPESLLEFLQPAGSRTKLDATTYNAPFMHRCAAYQFCAWDSWPVFLGTPGIIHCRRGHCVLFEASIASFKHQGILDIGQAWSLCRSMKSNLLASLVSQWPLVRLCEGDVYWLSPGAFPLLLAGQEGCRLMLAPLMTEAALRSVDALDPNITMNLVQSGAATAKRLADSFKANPPDAEQNVTVGNKESVTEEEYLNACVTFFTRVARSLDHRHGQHNQLVPYAANAATSSKSKKRSVASAKAHRKAKRPCAPRGGGPAQSDSPNEDDDIMGGGHSEDSDQSVLADATTPERMDQIPPPGLEDDEEPATTEMQTPSQAFAIKADVGAEVR